MNLNVSESSSLRFHKSTFTDLVQQVVDLLPKGNDSIANILELRQATHELLLTSIKGHAQCPEMTYLKACFAKKIHDLELFPQLILNQVEKIRELASIILTAYKLRNDPIPRPLPVDSDATWQDIGTLPNFLSTYQLDVHNQKIILNAYTGTNNQETATHLLVAYQNVHLDPAWAVIYRDSYESFESLITHYTEQISQALFQISTTTKEEANDPLRLNQVVTFLKTMPDSHLAKEILRNAAYALKILPTTRGSELLESLALIQTDLELLRDDIEIDRLLQSLNKQTQSAASISGGDAQDMLAMLINTYETARDNSNSSSFRHTSASTLQQLRLQNTQPPLEGPKQLSKIKEAPSDEHKEPKKPKSS